MVKIPFLARGERQSISGIAVSEYRLDDDETVTPSIMRSSQTMATYRHHYKTNPIVRAAVVEAVHAMIGIPLVAEEYSTTDQAWLPLPATDRLQQLLRKPSRSMPGAVFWGRMFTDYGTVGNLFMKKRRLAGGDKAPAEFWRLKPENTRPVPGTDAEVGEYVFDPTRQLSPLLKPSEDAQRYAVSEVVHIPTDPDPDDDLVGLSPIASALKHIDLHNAITEFTTSVMEHGGAVDKALVTKQRIAESESRRLERRWYRRQSGPRNAGKLVVIDGTEATLTNIGMSLSSREMGLTDLEKTVEALILMAMDVPPIVVGAVVGLENATYSNYMQAKLAFHEEHTDPNIWRLCSALEFSLADDFPEHSGRLIRIRPDLSRVMALLEWEDKRRRLALAEWNGGIVTQTEARADTNRPPLKNGDFYNLPLNMQRVYPETGPVTTPIPGVPTDAQSRPAPVSRMLAVRKALGQTRGTAVDALADYADELGVPGDVAGQLAIQALNEPGPANENREAQAWRTLASVHSGALRHIAEYGDALG